MQLNGQPTYGFGESVFPDKLLDMNPNGTEIELLPAAYILAAKLPA